MDAFVGIFSVLALAAVWWWLASKMKNNGRGWLLRNLAGSAAGFLAFTLIIITATSTGLVKAKSENEPSETTQASIEKQGEHSSGEAESQSIKVSKTLKIKPKEFATRVNTSLAKLEKPYRVNPANIKAGETVDVLSADLGKFTSLIAMVSKETGEITGLTVIGSGNGTASSGLEIMMITSTALAATIPNSDLKEILLKLPELIDGKDAIYGDIRLNARKSDQIGTWFFANPI